MDKFKSFVINFYKDNKDTILIPTAVMLAICLVITAALSVTNKITSPTIDQNSAAAKKETMKTALKAEEYKKATLKSNGEEIEYYTALSGKKEIGYIFTVSEKGYGGDVEVMIAVNPDCTVKRVCILDVSNETPGLGKNVAKDKFYSQFNGKSFGMKVVKNGMGDAENEIEAVSSATISSRAVTTAVNKALGYAESIVKAKEAPKK